MKKVLLGTSAIALAGAVAGQASAAEWDVKVGGYALSYVVYAQHDVKTPVGVIDPGVDGVDVWWDGEIHFKPSITLDNGIKIGADIQLEARAGAGGTADTIDEAYTYIKGSFGEVLIGDENSAGYKMHYGAPNRSGIGVNSPQTFFIPLTGSADLFRGTLGSTYIENNANNDAGRITYFTPRFAGFQVGVSYARDATQNTAGFQNNNGTAASDIIDVGANYVNSFGGFDVAVSGRWGTATDNRVAVAGTDIGSNPSVLGFGTTLGFAGFTIGGSWAEQNNAGNRDGTAYEIGVAYDTGPWGFSLNWFHGESVDNAIAVGALNNDESLDHYQIGVNYALAKGTNINLVGGYLDFDEETSSVAGNSPGGDDVDGFYVGTGLRISF